MKLMFASDIHGALLATEALLNRFAHSGASWLILLGDFLNLVLHRILSRSGGTATAKWIRCYCAFQ